MQSTFDLRSKAPFHFWAKANNARLCAHALSHISSDVASGFQEKSSYGGNSEIALHEGYLREAALSIELILKAIIARVRELENSDLGVPKNHDIPKLWTEARLPKLDDIDQSRLRQFKVVLEWSGRYATARTEEKFIKDAEETRPPPSGKLGSFEIYSPISLGWEHYDRIYSIASEKFYEMIN